MCYSMCNESAISNEIKYVTVNLPGRGPEKRELFEHQLFLKFRRIGVARANCNSARAGAENLSNLSGKNGESS